MQKVNSINLHNKIFTNSIDFTFSCLIKNVHFHFEKGTGSLKIKREREKERESAGSPRSISKEKLNFRNSSFIWISIVF